MLFRGIFGIILIWLISLGIRSLLESGTRLASGGPGPVTDGVRRQQALASLGLSDGASPSQIRQAYKALAKKYHPDRVAHLGPELVELTAEKFKEINEAYEFLSGEK